VTSAAARQAVLRSPWLRNLAILGALLIVAAIVYAVVSRGPSVPDLTDNGVDLGKEVTSVFDTATQTLQGVKDAASAGAALPNQYQARWSD
jgi:hypothetical protein